eukprot:6491836-Heterocapsa_arctica.AAC.1
MLLCQVLHPLVHIALPAIARESMHNREHPFMRPAGCAYGFHPLKHSIARRTCGALTSSSLSVHPFHVHDLGLARLFASQSICIGRRQQQWEPTGRDKGATDMSNVYRHKDVHRMRASHRQARVTLINPVCHAATGSEGLRQLLPDESGSDRGAGEPGPHPWRGPHGGEGVGLVEGRGCQLIVGGSDPDQCATAS